jgi:hypothetical protein
MAKRQSADGQEIKNQLMSFSKLQFQGIRSYAAITAVVASLGAATPARLEASDNRAPELPADLPRPEGSKVHFHAYAAGVQIYTWNGFTWGASVPEAVLYDDDGKIVGSHYVGPTWESSSGSKVVGAVVLPRVTVDPDAIPWLLLSAVHTEGPGIFAATTFIHRVNTVGGKAPATAGAFVGQVAEVPYTAEYFFYRDAND